MGVLIELKHPLMLSGAPELSCFRLEPCSVVGRIGSPRETSQRAATFRHAAAVKGPELDTCIFIEPLHCCVLSCTRYVYPSLLFYQFRTIAHPYAMEPLSPFTAVPAFFSTQPTPPPSPPWNCRRLRKYLETNALMRQAHMVAEGNPRVADHLTSLGEEVGGTVTLEGFARLAVGERESPSSSE